MSPRVSMWLARALLAGLVYGCFCLPYLLELTRSDEGYVESELVWPTVSPVPPAPVVNRPRKMRIYSGGARYQEVEIRNGAEVIREVVVEFPSPRDSRTQNDD